MEKTNISGMIFDIQHFSVSDGPGIRTTVFLKGCPLRCEWCHNPESYISDIQILFYSSLCMNCGKCVAVCLQNCHRIENNIHIYDRTACVSCGECTAVCPSEALKTAGKRMTDDEVLKEVSEDMFFYESSGGGITLSGGEPLFQPEFAMAIAKKAKERGIHVCMETSGFCKTEYLQNIVPYIDLFLYDYKVTGDVRHKQFTGVSQDLILKNLFLLDTLGAKIILRCPMVPGRNMCEEHIRGIISTAQKLKHLQEIHLEPYHTIGISKRENLGMDTESQVTSSVSKEELLATAERIQEETNIKTRIM